MVFEWFRLNLTQSIEYDSLAIFYSVHLLIMSCDHHYQTWVLVKLEFYGVATATSTTLSPKIATFTSRHSATCAIVWSVLYVTVSSMESRGLQCQELAAASTTWTGPMCHKCWMRYLWAVTSMLLCFLCKLMINCLITCIVTALICCIVLHLYTLHI